MPARHRARRIVLTATDRPLRGFGAVDCARFPGDRGQNVALCVQPFVGKSPGACAWGALPSCEIIGPSSPDPFEKPLAKTRGFSPAKSDTMVHAPNVLHIGEAAYLG